MIADREITSVQCENCLIPVIDADNSVDLAYLNNNQVVIKTFCSWSCLRRWVDERVVL
jgi:hypothetical protein